MYLNLPYTKIWVKESFLQGPDNFKFGRDANMLEAYLIGVRATPYEPPLYEVYIPKYNAILSQRFYNNRDPLDEAH